MDQLQERRGSLIPAQQHVCDSTCKLLLLLVPAGVHRALSEQRSSGVVQLQLAPAWQRRGTALH